MKMKVVSVFLMASLAIAGCGSIAASEIAQSKQVGENPRGEGVSAEGVSGESVSGEGVSGEGVSGESVSAEGVSGESVSAEAVSGVSVSGESVSGESVLGESVSGESVLEESVSGEGASGEGVVEETETKGREKPSAETGAQNQTPSSWSTATQTGAFGTISIRLPKDWSYECVPQDSEKNRGTEYGIHFYPKNVGKGYVQVGYTSGWGVCGTGLKEEKRTIAGCEAYVGYYDGSDIWDFVSLEEPYENIKAVSFDAEKWDHEYLEEAIDIIDTLKFDPDQREGAVNIYDESSEIYELGLELCMSNITRTGATLLFTQDGTMNTETGEPLGGMSFGEEYAIQKKAGKKWKEIPVVVKGDYGFNDLAYLIKMNDTTEYEVNWEWLYGELPEGEYRIDKKVMFNGQNYEVFARFLIAG